MGGQIAMFHDTPKDALGADVTAIGEGSIKKAAGLIWPSDHPDTAYARLRAALSATNDQKLSLDETLRVKQLARDVGSYALVNYEAQTLGYRVEWVDPKDEADQLRREIRDGLTALNRKVERLDRAETRALKAIG